jgi:hypothetical protein
MNQMILSVILTVGMGVSIAAADEPATALVGIAHVAVTADRLPPALASARLTTETLIADVERRLVGRGLTVGAKPADATIYIIVNAVPIDTSSGRKAGVAYTVNLAVEQQATVTFNMVNAPVTTWRRGGMGVTIPRRASDAIRRQLDEYVDMLLKDLASVNIRAK